MSKVRRLFPQFQPEHYALELELHREKLAFSGTVTIRGRKTKPSERLTLHAKGLTISKAIIIKKDKKGDREYLPTRIAKHASFEEVRLHTEAALYPGIYEVTLHFEGKITTPMQGIYPCFFTHENTDKRLIATQLESHFAREVFPCIDEPEAKATFDINLISPDDPSHVVLANTPLKSQDIIQKNNLPFRKSVFETTPKMPTYLLAFVEGELQSKQKTTSGGVTVRTWATPDNIQHTDFALDVAVKTLDFFDEYFSIPYPLKKCDLVALPDFAAGAMENWGLITFREQALLVDPANTDTSGKQWVAMVVAHELAHQWFGNLVTMQWWTDLWLNEGFASWVEYLAVDKLFPDWKMWEQFIAHEHQAALKLDALENTHPVEVPIQHPDEIRVIFDAISYNKGACVIRMLHEYLGAETFRKGLAHYLRSHAYGNARTDDLWQALETDSGKPVRAFMSAWTKQPGFPLLSVESNGGHITISQQRFYLNPEAQKDETALWPIPIYGGDTLSGVVIDSESATLTASENALPINQNTRSFIRVKYSPELLQHISHKLDENEMSGPDRLGLLVDTFETIKAGYLDAVSGVELLKKYRNETEAPVWDVMASEIGSIRRVMDDSSIRKDSKPFLRWLAEPHVERLGWEQKPNDTHYDILVRPTVLGTAAAGDLKLVVDEALNRFNDMNKPEDAHPDIRGVIYGTAVRKGNADTYEKFLRFYRQTQSAEERQALSSALTGFRQINLVENALSMIKTPDVRLQDVLYWVAYSLMNRHGRLVAWEWVKENWQWLKDNLAGDIGFTSLPLYAARSFMSRQFLEEEFTPFFEDRVEPMIERSYKQGIETLSWQIAWRERDHDAVESYFRNYR